MLWEVPSQCLLSEMLPLSHATLCTQATKGGTIKAASGFSATEHAQSLRKAMKGLGESLARGEPSLVLWQ
jgi:hypothetical protein